MNYDSSTSELPNINIPGNESVDASKLPKLPCHNVGDDKQGSKETEENMYKIRIESRRHRKFSLKPKKIFKKIKSFNIQRLQGLPEREQLEVDLRETHADEKELDLDELNEPSSPVVYFDSNSLQITEVNSAVDSTISERNDVNSQRSKTTINAPNVNAMELTMVTPMCYSSGAAVSTAIEGSSVKDSKCLEDSKSSDLFDFDIFEGTELLGTPTSDATCAILIKTKKNEHQENVILEERKEAEETKPRVFTRGQSNCSGKSLNDAGQEISLKETQKNYGITEDGPIVKDNESRSKNQECSTSKGQDASETPAYQPSYDTSSMSKLGQSVTFDDVLGSIDSTQIASSFTSLFDNIDKKLIGIYGQEDRKSNSASNVGGNSTMQTGEEMTLEGMKNLFGSLDEASETEVEPISLEPLDQGSYSGQQAQSFSKEVDAIVENIESTREETIFEETKKKLSRWSIGSKKDILSAFRKKRNKLKKYVQKNQKLDNKQPLDKDQQNELEELRQKLQAANSSENDSDDDLQLKNEKLQALIEELTQKKAALVVENNTLLKAKADLDVQYQAQSKDLSTRLEASKKKVKDLERQIVTVSGKTEFVDMLFDEMTHILSLGNFEDAGKPLPRKGVMTTIQAEPIGTVEGAPASSGDRPETKTEMLSQNTSARDEDESTNKTHEPVEEVVSFAARKGNDTTDTAPSEETKEKLVATAETITTRTSGISQSESELATETRPRSRSLLPTEFTISEVFPTAIHSGGFSETIPVGDPNASVNSSGLPTAVSGPPQQLLSNGEDTLEYRNEKTSGVTSNEETREGIANGQEPNKKLVEFVCARTDIDDENEKKQPNTNGVELEANTVADTTVPKAKRRSVGWFKRRKKTIPSKPKAKRYSYSIRGRTDHETLATGE